MTTSVRRQRDWKAIEHEVCATDDVSDDGEMMDLLGRPHSPTESSLRRQHANLGLPKNNVLIRQLRHAHASKQALGTTKPFECPACDDAKFSEVTHPSSLTEVMLSLKTITRGKSWIALPGSVIKASPEQLRQADRGTSRVASGRSSVADETVGLR